MCVCVCACMHTYMHVCVCVWVFDGAGGRVGQIFQWGQILPLHSLPGTYEEPLNLQSGPRYSPCSPFIRLTLLIHDIPLWSCELKDGFRSGRSAQPSTRTSAPAGSGACQNDSNTCCKVVLLHATRLLGFAPFRFSHSSTAVEDFFFGRRTAGKRVKWYSIPPPPCPCFKRSM